MTFGTPAVPDKDDPRWTRRNGIFVRRDEGVTKWMTGDTTTVKISSAQTGGALVGLGHVGAGSGMSR
ncbi:hypothetical protein [Streptomyces sp. NPDC001933]|uniref:hypothetical protein n=1 Tax=Streptomyces sp. NPDC001933 TaxID=3364626 RepID=UPI0036AAC323